jgi:hypothetical protein
MWMAGFAARTRPSEGNFMNFGQKLWYLKMLQAKKRCSSLPIYQAFQKAFQIISETVSKKVSGFHEVRSFSIPHIPILARCCRMRFMHFIRFK